MSRRGYDFDDLPARLVWETEGWVGAAERGWLGEAAREEAEEILRQEAEAYAREQARQQYEDEVMLRSGEEKP